MDQYTEEQLRDLQSRVRKLERKTEPYEPWHFYALSESNMDKLMAMVKEYWLESSVTVTVNTAGYYDVTCKMRKPQ
jgi:hypothetical protein